MAVKRSLISAGRRRESNVDSFSLFRMDNQYIGHISQDIQYIGVQCSVLSAGERERERRIGKKKSAFRKSVNVARGGKGETLRKRQPEKASGKNCTLMYPPSLIGTSNAGPSLKGQ